MPTINDKKVKELERQIKKIDNEVSAAVDASLIAPKKALPKYFEKIEILETQKSDIELNLATLRIASARRYSEEEIIAWLKSFCNGDIYDESFQRRIIDVLVNSVYVYDDKIVIYYNIKGGKQVSFIDMCEDIESNLVPTENGSDIHYNTGSALSERVRISYNTPRNNENGQFNCICEVDENSCC